MKVLVDGHCDTIQLALDQGKQINDTKLNFNIVQAPQPSIQMMAAFIHPKYENAFERAKQIIEYFYNQQQKFTKQINTITTKKDLEQTINQKKVGAILTIENGRAIENKIENVDYFYQRGVRAMSINWNEDNLLGCGALTKNDNGLTPLGKKYIKKLNTRNIIVDVSHSSEKTFWDMAKINTKEIVATHSCCKSLCHHPRNLSDEQIKQIANTNGIVGVCYCSEFLQENGVASTVQIVKHIAYIVNLVGIDYVGLGSDFDRIRKAEHTNRFTRY